MRKALCIIALLLAYTLVGWAQSETKKSIQLTTIIHSTVDAGVPDLETIRAHQFGLYYSREIRKNWGYDIGFIYRPGYYTNHVNNSYASPKSGYEYLFQYRMGWLKNSSFMLPAELYYDLALGRRDQWHITPHVGIYASENRAIYNLRVILDNYQRYFSSPLYLYSEYFLDFGSSLRLDLTYALSDHFRLGLTYQLLYSLVPNRRIEISDDYNGLETYRDFIKYDEDTHLGGYIENQLLSHYYLNTSSLNVSVSVHF